jgi:membrane protein
MSDRRRLKHRVADKVREVEARAALSHRKRVRAPLFAWRVTVQVVRQWKRDRCPQQAASLSFQTLVSLVPALAVGLAAFRAMDLLREESALVDYLARELIPLSREEIAGHLLKWSENVTFESLGLVGLISIIPIAFVVFNNLEQSVNHIWRVGRKRRLYKRLLVFYATATLGPLIFGWSLYQATKVGLTEGWSGAVFSVLSTFVGLLLANLLLPLTRVRLMPAAIGALVTTILAELAKFGFAAYVNAFALERYAGIYGAVAAILLWLIWIYWSWVMFLLGIEISHALQNLHVLERFDRRGPMTLERELSSHINGAMALRVAARIAADAGTSADALAYRFELSSDAMRIIARRLISEGMVRRAGDGFALARPADQIEVEDVLDVFRLDPIESPTDSSDPVENLLARIHEARLGACAGLTLADLESSGPVVDGSTNGVETVTDQSKADNAGDPDGLVP